MAASVVLAPGVALYGAAFGVLAAGAGLSLAEAALFSAWVHAGGAQMASMQAWADPVPLLAVVLTTLAMNSRYLLLGAALRPRYGGLPAHQIYPSLFLMGDGNWALAQREFASGRVDAAFLMGSGLPLWFAWIASTMLGQAFGSLLGQPERFGIDFLLTAFFAAMVVGFYRGSASLLPFAIGALAAVAVEQYAGGPWHILAGALAGSLAGALRPGGGNADEN
ncbi:MAG: AzlC family ABC transporter permease [Candidatus Parcubacteria bacterium]|nr:AzlC family ABC transporter permease [Burkholderiales bacterium]